MAVSPSLWAPPPVTVPPADGSAVVVRVYCWGATVRASVASSQSASRAVRVYSPLFQSAAGVPVMVRSSALNVRPSGRAGVSS